MTHFKRTGDALSLRNKGSSSYLWGEEGREYHQQPMDIAYLETKRSIGTPHLKLDGDSVFRERHLEKAFRKKQIHGSSIV